MTPEEMVRAHHDHRAHLDRAAEAVIDLWPVVPTRHIVSALLEDYEQRGTLPQRDAISLGAHVLRSHLPGLDRAVKYSARALLDATAACQGCSRAELLAAVLRRWTIMQGRGATDISGTLTEAVVALEEMAIEADRWDETVGEEFARARAARARRAGAR